MMQTMNETKFYPEVKFSRNIWLVLAILVAGFFITAVTAFHVRMDVEADARHEFESSCNEIKLKIEARLQAHARILRSGAAFFDASNDVTREKWHTFILRKRVEQQLPGIQGIGFSLVIPLERLAQHEQEIRSQGFSQYHVRPEGRRDIYTSIIYLEPFEGRNLRAFGYDMFSEPVRRDAMERARDTDAAALSGKVVLVQETDKDVQAGTLMYVPVYRKGIPTNTVEQRRAAIYGWAYSPYRMNDLMQGILGELDKKKGIHLKVFDGEELSPDTLLYDCDKALDGQKDKDTASGYESSLTLNSQIVSAGRTWTLSFRKDGKTVRTIFFRIWIVIYCGTIISILLSILAWSLLNTSFRARQIAEKLTVALSESEERYKNLSNLTFEGIFFHTDGIIIDCNLSFARLTGYSREELLGKDSVELLIPENHRPIVRENIAGKVIKAYEAELLIKNNILIPVEIQAKNIVFKGKEMRVAAVRDITQRKLIQNALRKSEKKYRNLFESMNNGLAYCELVVDQNNQPIDFIYLEVNKAFERITGIKQKSIIGKRVTEVFPDFIESESYNHRFNIYSDVALTGRPANLESFFQPTGQWLTISVYSPENGYFVAIFDDITDQKQADDALRISLEKYKVLFETLPIGISVTDSNGNLLEANPESAHLLGISVSKHIERKIDGSEWKIVRRDMTPMPAEEYASVRALKTKQLVSNVEMGIVKDGQDITWISVNAMPVPIEGYGVIITYSDITDRKQAENALAKIAEEQRILLDNLEIQVWYLTDEHTYGAVNKFHAEFNGVKKEDLAFKDLYDIFPKHVADICKQGNIEVFTTAKPVLKEEWLPHVSGENRLCSILKVPKVGLNGKVEYVVCSAEDITDRKEAEEKLLESEANFRAFFNAMTDIIVIGSEDGKILFTNHVVEKKLGYSYAELENMHILDFHPVELQSEANEIFAAMLRGERDSCPLPLIDKNGALIPVETRIWLGEWNNTECIFGLIKDLSAEQESKQRFERLFINNPALMAISELPDRRLVDVNAAFEKTIGYSKKELVGKTTAEMGMFTDIGAINFIKEKLQTDRRVVDVEMEVKCKDGRVLNGIFSGEIIRDQGREYFLSVMVDITQRKRVEKQLIETNRQLEDAIHRANEMAKKAQMADIAKSEFLATMSHEIRTPMNAIVNMTRLLSDTLLDEEQQDYVETAMTSSELLLSLINDILDFSKIEAGKLELENINFDLRDIVQSVAKIIKGRADEKELSLTYSIDSAVHNYLVGDSMRIRQILLNFLNNAVKFTHKGGIAVRVSSEHETDTHTTVKFEITDTGIGIPDYRLNLLFKPFSQVDASTSRKYGGTGLGLRISKQLAELMGGEVGVQSEEGKGSTFWFTALLKNCTEADVMDAEDDSESSSNVSGTNGKIPFSSLNILVAEDNIPNQKVALAILKTFGLAADVANNGREAVEALRLKDYHLVLMDMQMPEMDGVEATRIIRNPDSGVVNPHIPVIAMTANTTKEDHQKCIDAGMNDFISKPVQPDQLVSVIRKQVDVQKPDVRQKMTSKVKYEDSGSIKKVFDRQDFLSRINWNEEILKALISTLPAFLFEEISKLKSALDRKNAGDIRLHAHTIKGTCGSFSAERLCDTAYRIEEAAKEGLTDIAASMMEKLEQEAMALKLVLSEMFPEIFNTNSTDKLEILSDHSPEIEIIFPPDAELKILYELAMFGRILQIENFTAQLKAMDARYSAFADKVSSMAAACKDDEIVGLIQSHFDEK